VEKIYILDTNVLIHNPNALFAFEENRVVIPMVVIEEIDQFKKNLDEKGRNARQIGRYLDTLRKSGSLKDGVKTERGGIIQVTVMNDQIAKSGNMFFLDKNDNLIIGTALYFKEKFPEHDVILISKDTNVRIKADAIGITSDNFNDDAVNFEEMYSGFITLKVPQKQIDSYHSDGFMMADREYFPNQYIKLVSEEDPENEDNQILGRYYSQEKSIQMLKSYSLEQDIFGISARNLEQIMALDLLLDDDIKMVSLSGIAGTGKTLLAMAAGLQKVVEEDLYKRLVISRPISPLGKDLGYLPGTKSEKFNPWMQPIYDNMEILISNHQDYYHKDNVRVFGKKNVGLVDFLDFGFIELEPLTYIRGRNLPNQFMIIDEAQNLTPHEMKTIITRAGEGTKIVLTGDPYQIDIPYLDSQSNGLSRAVELLKNEDLVGHVTLQKGERSKLAEMAAKYF
jgi:PhoH-like ATPase